jgi:hypothetical protein
MNEIKQPSRQEDNLPTVLHAATTKTETQPVLHWPRDWRVLPVLTVIAMVIAFRLVFLYAPLARAATWKWDSIWSLSGGAWWDYPCSDSCCAPGSEGPIVTRADSPVGGQSAAHGSGGGGQLSGGGGRGQLYGGSSGAGCSQCGASGGGFRESLPQAGGGAGGMPVLWVSEPIMTLWLKDVPLSYQPSHGESLQFQLLLKSQLDLDSEKEMNPPKIFSVGKNWFTPWRAYLRTNDSATLYFNGRGGIVDFTTETTDYRQHSQFVPPSGTTPPMIKYADGSYDVFGWHFDAGDGYSREFRTKHYDREGNATTFNWATVLDVNLQPVACLTNIVDVDGNQTTLSYTNLDYYHTDSAIVLDQVTDPCNHTTTLQYYLDSMYTGFTFLTNITDSAGLSSSMEYSGSLPSSLHTPYGTTTFSIVVTEDTVSRAVHVNELGLRDHLYLYEDYDVTYRFTNSYAAWRPSTTNSGVFSFPNTFDSEDMDQRNTFYWGPREYPLLSAGFISSLTNASPRIDTSQLYGTNYLQARHRHWLIDTVEDQSLSQTLSLERVPSPDGVTQGQITWYDYDGKVDGSAEAQGTMNQPLFKAWKLPSGESRFIRYERNSLG